MNAIGIALVWCVVQVTLACAAGAAVYLAARKTGWTAARISAFVPLVLVLALSAVALSPWPSWLSSSAVESTAVVSAGNTSARQNVLPNNVGSRADADSVATESQAQANGPLAPLNPLTGAFWKSVWAQMLHTSATTETTNGSAGSGWRWPAFVASVLLVAAAAGLLRLVIACFALRRLDRQSTTLNDRRLMQLASSIGRELPPGRTVALKESPELRSAATFGWRRPVLLLPAEWRDWPQDELRAVLAHELAHVARGDFAKWLLAQLAVAIHFYHPLVHWFAGRLRLEQELAADATAVRFAGGREPYLQSLVALTLRADHLRPGWAAQTFLPTRSMFFRRIEMLKRTKSMTQETFGGKARFALIGVIMAIGLLAGGLRMPGPISTTQLVAAEPASQNSDPDQGTKPDQSTSKSNPDDYDFAYVPERFIFLLAIRPADMASSPQLAPLAELLSENSRPSIPSDALQQVTLVMPYPQLNHKGHLIPGTGGEYTIFRTNRAIDFRKPLEASYGALKTEQHKSQEFWTWSPRLGTIAFHSPDEKTLLGQARPGLFDVMDNPKAAQPPTQAVAWQEAATGPLFGIVNVKAYREMQGNQPVGKLPGGFVLQMLAPILSNVDHVTITVDGQDELLLKAQSVCTDPQQVPVVEQTVQSALLLLGNVVASQMQALKEMQDDDSKATAILLSLVDHAIKKAELTSDGRYLRLSTSLGNLQAILRDTLPIIQAAGTTAKREQKKIGLKRIALALLNYENAHGHLPPAVLYDKETGTPYSWRVAVLPFLEQQALFDHYRFDEPWDSEHNLEIAKTVVPTFASPTEPTSTSTAYFALVGSETAFAGKEAVKLAQIRDGLSHTLLVVEAKRNIPWTKPEDIPYKHDEPLPILGGHFEGGFHAAFCDGSVQFLDNHVGQKTLRNLIEKADGNRLHPPAIQK